MKTYKTKPVEIQAIELTIENLCQNKEGRFYVYRGKNHCRLFFSHYVKPVVGDYVIIQNINDVYHCSKDVFLC